MPSPTYSVSPRSMRAHEPRALSSGRGRPSACCRDAERAAPSRAPAAGASPQTIHTLEPVAPAARRPRARASARTRPRTGKRAPLCPSRASTVVAARSRARPGAAQRRAPSRQAHPPSGSSSRPCARAARAPARPRGEAARPRGRARRRGSGSPGGCCAPPGRRARRARVARRAAPTRADPRSSSAPEGERAGLVEDTWRTAGSAVEQVWRRARRSPRGAARRRASSYASGVAMPSAHGQVTTSSADRDVERPLAGPRGPATRASPSAGEREHADH